MKTLSDVRAANHAAGHHFFERGAMRFFDSRIESKLIAGRYFVTSEQFDTDSPRLFTVRIAHPNGKITTAGEFQEFATRELALEAAQDAAS